MTIKRLNDALRDKRLYAQTKALYSYLYVRADHKTNLAYPPKKQILEELNLTEPLFIQGISVLENRGYIKLGTGTGTNKDTGEQYTYTTYQLLD